MTQTTAPAAFSPSNLVALYLAEYAPGARADIRDLAATARRKGLVDSVTDVFDAAQSYRGIAPSAFVATWTIAIG